MLYPNERLQRVRHPAVDRDINECMQHAEEYVSSGGGGKALEQAAVGGAIIGRAGTGTAVGAAGDGAAGVIRGLIHGLTCKQSPGPVYKNFVDRCLREKGYDPIGWQ